MREEINIHQIDEKYEKYTLDNNLKVYVYSNEELSEYYASFTTYYGSNFDEIPGTAHFLEHSLFTKEDGDIFKKFAQNNASCNAFTSNHQTTYYFTSSDKFAENLTLLQVLVNDGFFSQKNVDKEMGIIEEEIIMYAQSSDTKIRNTTLKNACIRANYGIDIAGTVDSINLLTPEILKNVHSKFYVPSNQAIVMSGNFEGIDVISLINQINDAKVERVEIIEDENVNIKNDVITIEDINVDMFTHSIKFRTELNMEENIRDYITINVFLSSYFSHTNEVYLRYKKENKFTSLLEHSLIVTPSLKMLYFEMNFDNNENVIKEFLNEIKINKNELARGLTKVKAFEIRQVSNKKRIMENVMYSLSDNFEYSNYIEVLFSLTVDEIFERITRLLSQCNESQLVFMSIKDGEELDAAGNKIENEETKSGSNIGEKGFDKLKKYSKTTIFFLKKNFIISINKFKKYLYNRIYLKRVAAKGIDFIINILIFLFALFLVTFVQYLVVVNLEIIFTTLLNITMFATLAMCLFLSFIYHNYFSLGRKIFKLEKISMVKKSYSEPIFHFNLLLIYFVIINSIFTTVAITPFIFIFILLYFVSFSINGGFWNKKNTIMRSNI